MEGQRERKLSAMRGEGTDRLGNGQDHQREGEVEDEDEVKGTSHHSTK